MGMIGASSGAPPGREDLEERLDEATSAGPLALPQDRHFSVSPRHAAGYRLQVIEEIVVIGGNGQVVAVEHPDLPFGERRRQGSMRVPVATLSKAQDRLRFLWGSSRSVFGLSGALPGPSVEARASDDHLKYKALHHRILEGVGDIALQAFLRFLERGTASVVSAYPTVAEHPRCKLAFRFEYDEHYLHERHAAQLAWKRFLAGSPCRADEATFAR